MKLTVPSSVACWLVLAGLFSSWVFPSTGSGDVITTTFASNNRQSGNMFNTNIVWLPGLRIEQFALNLLPGTWNVEVYTRSGSYVGNETNPAAWTLRDSLAGLVSAGTNQPTLWNVNDFDIGPGVNAFYMRVANGTAMNYTNGTSEGALYTSDANIQIFQGTGNAGFFGQQFRPRVWNGSIYYSQIMDIPEPSAMTVAGLFLMIAFGGTRRRRQGSGF
jgi:hypothetical protein